MSLPINQVLCGDCVEVMKAFPESSIDCVVTDPPYGIGFMGKDWDSALPPKESFAEVFRVLKSGALAFVMSSPRQDVLWRMLKMLEECGFKLRQSFISWIYKSGMPKAYDLSLGIDKKFIREEFVAKHGRKPTKEEMKELLKEKRKVVEVEPFGRENRKSAIRGFGAGEYDGGLIKSTLKEVSKGYTKEAKKWEGWKGVTGLKPALECILMVNKPLSEKTIVDNVLKHGTGAINVDACRIPFKSEEDIQDAQVGFKRGWTSPDMKTGWHRPAHENYKVMPTNLKGRFPANLIVSDKALDTGKTTKSPNSYIRKARGFNQTAYGKGMGQNEGTFSQNYGDVGDQSRYFNLDAWAVHHGFLDVAKASKKERDKGLKDFEGIVRFGSLPESGKMLPSKKEGIESHKIKGNYHPTVKPVKLMAYLIELGCPPDGVVLDPFVGTGTTLIASHRLNRKWIGIDIEPEYVKISQHRLATLDQKIENFLEG